MTNRHIAERDERTLAVADTSYRVAYTAATLALLIDVIVRSYRGEAAWDLFGIVMGSGLVATCYQAWQKALPGGWVRYGLIAAGVAFVIAAAAVIFIFRL
jgi:FtsP/CotA-like multicopper oxidase with cupredoxin domain